MAISNKFDGTEMKSYLQRKFSKLATYAYALFDSKVVLSRNEPVLFVDCGSNIGQGYKWFSVFYNKKNIDFHLFEPNPYCHPYLETIEGNANGMVKLYKAGVGTINGTVKFYGLADSEGGKLSHGGSIKREHNSGLYKASENETIEVEIIDFSAYLTAQSKQYRQIVVKMDIEGAEIDLLENLISSGKINLIDILYVEFHSQYQSPSHSRFTSAREDQIVSRLKKQSSIKLRMWH